MQQRPLVALPDNHQECTGFSSDKVRERSLAVQSVENPMPNVVRGSNHFVLDLIVPVWRCKVELN